MATDIGKVGIRMRGTYSSANTYEVLDAVQYNNGTYIAKQEVPANTAPTNTTYWQAAMIPDSESYSLSNIGLEYQSAGSTPPTYTMSSISSFERTGTTVSFYLYFTISNVGSGSILKVTGLPAVAPNPRVSVQLGGPAIGGLSEAIVIGPDNTIILHKSNGTNVSYLDITTGDLFVSGTFALKL